jgi:hypothetical protein
VQTCAYLRFPEVPEPSLPSIAARARSPLVPLPRVERWVFVDRLKCSRSRLFTSPTFLLSLSTPFPLFNLREGSVMAQASPKFAHSIKQQEVVIPDLTIKDLLGAIP